MKTRGSLFGPWCSYEKKVFTWEWTVFMWKDKVLVTRFLYENMKFMRFFLLKHDVTQDI